LIYKGGGVHLDQRFADTRAERRTRGGIGAGALSGAAFGLMLGAASGAGSSAAAGLVVLVGAVAGALLGKAAADRVSLDDLDRNPSDRSFVGAHTPDDESSQDSSDGS
jgi:hypothetical protein